MVQRYDLPNSRMCDRCVLYIDDMDKDQDGDYVLYENYAALEAEIERLRDAANLVLDSFPILNNKYCILTLDNKFMLNVIGDRLDNLKAALAGKPVD